MTYEIKGVVYLTDKNDNQIEMEASEFLNHEEVEVDDIIVKASEFVPLMDGDFYEKPVEYVDDEQMLAEAEGIFKQMLEEEAEAQGYILDDYDITVG